ncbi:uncharacterized protein VTP21DRAFT_1792 [Calcarisporiella thermophila]|uniref:uncharacterized protein n=1 Tax=Calcarisporiella thermophila TaxID=911321 RepID=UPI0037438079
MAGPPPSHFNTSPNLSLALSSRSQSTVPPQPPQPRQYASRACKRCRTRKVKCDFEYPTCGRCLRAGLQCEYVETVQAVVDERRELETFLESFGQKIKAMCERLESLEENLRLARQTYLLEDKTPAQPQMEYEEPNSKRMRYE